MMDRGSHPINRYWGTLTNENMTGTTTTSTVTTMARASFWQLYDTGFWSWVICRLSCWATFFSVVAFCCVSQETTLAIAALPFALASGLYGFFFAFSIISAFCSYLGFFSEAVLSPAALAIFCQSSKECNVRNGRLANSPNAFRKFFFLPCCA